MGSVRPHPSIASDVPRSDELRFSTAILVVSCDRYADLWPHFFGCFFKYWEDCPYRVILGTNNLKHDDPRVTTICIGEDKDYSSNLAAMLNKIDEEWVVVLVEDVLISAKVDSNRIATLLSTLQSSNIVHAQLLYQKYSQNNLLGDCEPMGGGIVELPVGIPYRATLNACLWRKLALLGLLREGESAWEFERDGTVRSFGYPGRFVSATRPGGEPLFRWEHGVIKGRWTWEAARFIKHQAKTGPLHRPVRSFGSFLRLQIYCILRYSVFWLAYKIYGARGLMKNVRLRSKLK